jgi:hypothetical protein
MKVATFSVITTRYIRLEAVSAVNSFAAATEVMAGLSCPPSRISPYFRINEGAWQQISDVFVEPGNKVY